MMKNVATALDWTALALVVAVLFGGTQSGGASLPHQSALLAGGIFAAAALLAISRVLAAPRRKAHDPGDASLFAPVAFRRTMVFLAVALLGLVFLQTVDLPAWLQGVLSPRAHALSDELTAHLDDVVDWRDDAVPVDVQRTLSLAPDSTRAALLVLAAGIALYFVLTEALRSRVQVTTFAAALLGIGMVQAGIALYQVILADQSGIGTYPNRNYFAGVLEMTAPLALALILDRSAEVRKDMNQRERLVATILQLTRITWKLALIAVFVLCAATVFLSRSRMGVIGICIGALAMMFFFAHGNWRKLQAQLFLVALLGLVGLFGLSLVMGDHPTIQRFSLLATGTDVGALSRLEVWQDSLEMIKDYPMTGVGLGAFGHAHQLYQDSTAQAPHFEFAHNDWLNWITDVGVIGFLIVLTGLVLSLRKLFYRHSRLRTFQRGLVAGLFAGLVALLAHSLVDFNLQVPANGLLFAALLGTATATVELDEIRPHRKKGHRR